MITRSVDLNHDFNFGKGKQDYLSEEDALAQNIKTRLLSFTNDCFFDMTAGVDWFNFLGNKNLTGLRLSISKIIQETTGVEELTQLSFNLDEDRKLSIVYSVTTAWGTVVQGTVGV